MKKFNTLLVALLFTSSLVLSGCAAALLAGGAIGGYAIAKDMEDGKLIDTKEKKKKEGNKGWFGGGDDED
jgi:hypothetical protein